MKDIIYPKLSYKIMGILFRTHTRLGGHFEEKYYQRAIEQLFLKEGILFNKELKADISFEGEKIGKFYLDFLVEGKVLVELKAVPVLLPIHFRQVKSYLKVKQLKLGILANFRGEKLSYKRILNSEIKIDMHDE